MNSMQWGNLIYLGILVTVLVSWFVVHNRQSLGKTAQMAAAWVFIFVAVIAAVGLWGDIRKTIMPHQSYVTDQGQIEVPRSNDGHYYLTLTINGKSVPFLVDTGATDVVLTQNDAARIGLNVGDLAYVGRAMTANGEVRTAPVRLQTVELGPIEDRNVAAWVNQGDMEQSLLGMAYLQRWSRIEITGGALVLTR